MTCQSCGANWIPSAESVKGHKVGSGSKLPMADYVCQTVCHQDVLYGPLQAQPAGDMHVLWPHLQQLRS